VMNASGGGADDDEGFDALAGDQHVGVNGGGDAPSGQNKSSKFKGLTWDRKDWCVPVFFIRIRQWTDYARHMCSAFL